MRIIHYSAERGAWEAVAFIDDEPEVEPLDLVRSSDQDRDGFMVDCDIETEIAGLDFLPALCNLYVKQ
jgi:hypothetical protein